MNPEFTLAFWRDSFGLLALQVAAVVAVAAVAHQLVKSAAWRRSIWQITLATAGLLTLVEWSGSGRIGMDWARKQFTAKPSSVVMAAPPEAPSPNPVSAPGVESSETTLDPAPVLPSVIQEIPAGIAAKIPEPIADTPSLTTAVWWPVWLWLTGFSVFLLRFILLNLSFAAFRWWRRRPVDPDLTARVQTLAPRLGLRRPVCVIAMQGLTGPVAFGVIRPTIGLPPDYSRDFTPAEQDAMLAHELAHLSAHDPAWSWLAEIVTAVLWWHPLVWWARWNLRATSEAAADEASALLPQGPETLAECLVNLGGKLAAGPVYGGLGVADRGFRSNLGRRVERLLKLQDGSWRPPGVWASLAAKTLSMIVLLTIMLTTGAWMSPRHGDDGTMINAAWHSLDVSAMSGLFAAQVTLPNPAAMISTNKVSTYVSGVVRLVGQPPPETEIAVPETVRAVRDGKPLYSRHFVVNEEGGLADVVVYVKSGLTQQKYAASFEKMELRAQDGQWEPYVSAIQTDSAMTVKLLEPELKLFQILGLHDNRSTFIIGSNRELPHLGFNQPELFVPVSGDVYPKMFAYVSVFDHPYFAVTDQKGRFRLPRRLPPGTYEIEAQHLKAGAATQTITVGDGAELNIQFTLAAVNPLTRTNTTFTSKGRQAIKDKLNRIQLNEVFFDSLPLGQVLKSLREESRKHDPDKVGINFFINPTVEPPSAVPDPNRPVTPPADLNTVTIRINPALNDLRLADVLDVIVKVADKPIQYTIEDYAIIFSPRQPQPLNLFTRTFKVDPADFIRGLTNAMGAVGTEPKGAVREPNNNDEFTIPRVTRNTVSSITPSPGTWGPYSENPDPLKTSQYGLAGGKPQSGIGISFGTQTNTTANLHTMVRDYFAKAGVDLNAPKTVFINERAGVLMVRATLEDLEIVQQAIETLNAPSLGLSGSIMVDPFRFAQAVRNSGVTNSGSGQPEMIRQYFKRAGVDLPASSYLYMERIGQLTVKSATQTELEIIGRTIQSIPRETGQPGRESQSRRALRAKLKGIILSEVSFDRVPIAEAVGILHSMARKNDTNGWGVSISLALSNNPALGSPNYPLVTVLPALTKISLADALDAVVRGASRPLRYDFQGYAVLVTDSSPESLILTSTFQIDRIAFPQHLRREGPVPDTRTVSELVEDFVAKAGVEMTPRKSVSFESLKGQLNVRATLDDLEKVEKALEALPAPVPGAKRDSPDQSAAAQRRAVNATGLAALGPDVYSLNATGYVTVHTNLGAAGTAELQSESLFTRMFKVDPRTFLNGLDRLVTVGPGTNVVNSGTNQNRLGGLTTNGGSPTNNSAETIESIRRFFTNAGVDLTASKTVFFNDRAGLLLVRATLADLEIIQQAIEILNTAPPQIVIEARFVEVTESDLKELGFSWLLSNQGATNSPNRAETTSTNDFSNIFTVTGILSDPQFKVVRKALEQRHGEEILSAPKTTTLSGRQAQIKIGALTNAFRSTLTEKTTPEESGPTLDLIPTVGADGYSIQMAINLTSFEYRSYDYDEFVIQTQGTAGRSIGVPITAQLPVPQFRLRTGTTNCSILEGQTLVLSGLVSTLVRKMKDGELVVDQFPGRSGRSELSSFKKKNLLIFITPTIIDAAGNRMHTSENMPKGIPDQQPRQSGSQK